MSMCLDRFVQQEGSLVGQLAVKPLLSRYHQSPAVVLGSILGVFQEVNHVVEKIAPSGRSSQAG